MKGITPRTESGIAAIAITAILLVIVLSLLVGCKTTTTVETVVIRDTVRVHHSDTIRDVRVVTLRDTTRQLETHTITLNNVGDTVREVHYYHDTNHTIIVDSTDRYKAIVDSLRKALGEKKEVVKVVKKSGTMYGRVIGVIVIALAVLVIYQLRRWGKK